MALNQITVIIVVQKLYASGGTVIAVSEKNNSASVIVTKQSRKAQHMHIIIMHKFKTVLARTLRENRMTVLSSGIIYLFPYPCICIKLSYNIVTFYIVHVYLWSIDIAKYYVTVMLYSS